MRRVHGAASHAGNCPRGRGFLKAVFKVARANANGFKNEYNVCLGRRRSAHRRLEKKNELRSSFNSFPINLTESQPARLKVQPLFGESCPGPSAELQSSLPGP